MMIKMSYYFPLLLLMVPQITRTNLAEAEVTALANPVPVIDQAQMAQVMDNLYSLLMPGYKKLYKKHYDQIEWIEHNYVTNRAKGDKILEEFTQEFLVMMGEVMDPFIDEIFKSMPSSQVPKELLAPMKEQMKQLFAQILPTSVIQGLKQNAELKSSVYQEIVAEKKARGRK